MKYEIIKGSEQDFYGAPEWATMKCHCTVGDPSEVRNENVAFSDGVVRGSRWVDASGDGYEGVTYREEQWHVIAERRPITEPVWNGEGLPPVGVECEIKRVADWFPVTIKFISGYYTVILTRGGAEDAFQTSALQFRPIPSRSPEDVVRDEAIAKMVSILNEGTSTQDDASDIYDAIAAGKIPGIKLE